ncbi:MAG: JDVT-CTERM system glutamic-type intramembrane protease [Desulfobulbales bacterium]|nr:JDVT-CTERM system glutamic-type intramembrane protease [Desulfobulbales bacterium]
MDHPGIKSIFRDYRFGLAILAAPVFRLIVHRFDLETFKFGASPGTMSQILLLLLAYPVLEEIVFRMGLQGMLARTGIGVKSRAGISIANLGASLIFAAFHLLSQPFALGAAIFFPSLIFGFFRDRYGSILPGIILHCWYNASFIVFLNP